MQSNLPEIKIPNGSDKKIGIVLPYFNDELGQELLMNTVNPLKEYGVKEENIVIQRVFGSLEIPFAAQKLSETVDSIIALGIIIEGETSHYDLVTNHCYQGLMQVQLTKEKPIIFGVLTCRTLEQVEERIDKNKLNKGKEFAIAALLQANL